MLGALGAELAPLQPCLQALATSHELSPAQIKSAALSAAYSARERSNSVDTDDLLQAAALELTKEGRSAPPQARATRHRGSGAHG
jgi:hypothetical protein